MAYENLSYEPDPPPQPEPDQGERHPVLLGLLGPLIFRRSGYTITPSAPKLRQVLALLVLQANSVTRVDQLVEELWEESPPPSALTTVQTYIYQLRKLLKLPGKTVTEDIAGADSSVPVRERGPVLLSHPGGYIFQLRSLADIDAYLFDQLAERGRQELLGNQVAEAADTLRVALGMWRGSVLEDVTTGPLLYAQAARLEERRRTVLGLRIEADLRLGRHQEITGELASLVSAEPTREDFSAKLMLALYRCGRRADALQVYQRIRTVLVEELGLDPAAELQRLHQLMLAADPTLDLPDGGTAPVTVTRAPTVTPAQLPPEVPDFVGRRAELAEFERILTSGSGQGLRVLNVIGRPGVGKSTFVNCAARQVRGHFPDGLLYVDLADAGSGRTDTGQVLLRFLKALGADEADVPASVAEAALMFRSWTADQRLLLVLDHADRPEHAEQMHHLLPGGSGCALVVTSRTGIGGLPGAKYLRLPVLSQDEAIELLAAGIGADRVAREPDQARLLTELTGALPLAMRAVSARLAARPSWALNRAVTRLLDEDTRLDELRYGGFDVAGRLAEAHRSLDPSRRVVFDALAAAVPEPSVPVLADRTGMSCPAVESAVDELVDADLVEEFDTGDDVVRYRVPELIRLAGRPVAGDRQTGSGAGQR